MSFFGAVQFLTRIPIRYTTAPASRSAIVPWFPIVGAFVGAAVGGVAAGLQYWLAPLAASAVAVVIGVLVTGAFHEDGLADLSDAVAGGATRERRFEILNDPRLGTYGAAAVCSSIVVRIAAVSGLAAVGPAAALAGAIAAHATSRGVAIGVIGLAPAASADGLGAAFGSDVSRRRSVATVAIALGIAAIATGWWAAVIVATAALAAAAIATVAVRALGGVNGDVAGACQQVAEAAALLVAAALAGHHALWWR